MTNKVLYTEKKAILNTKVGTEEIGPLEEHEVLMRVDKFALTSNNVTYAVTGHQIRYWEFFPVKEPWGIVPVWGFATVVESNQEGVEVGEKVYGYFPMAQYLKIKAGKVNEYLFYDVSEHRNELAAVYNTYNREGMSLEYPEGIEDYMPIAKPLFLTSFLINEFLRIEDFFSAKKVIITSASSKTSLGLAFCLSKLKNDLEKNIIGLTSSRNVDFVKETGLYSSVIDYENVNEEVPAEDSVIVDMAGNGVLNAKLYDHLGDHLKHLCKVGLTDWSKANNVVKIPVARFFFAPTYATGFYKEHGPAKANKIVTDALFSFIKTASDWIDLEYINSFEQLQATFVDMIKGKVDPSKGYIVKN